MSALEPDVFAVRSGALLAVRALSIVASLALGGAAAALFLQFGAADGLDVVDVIRSALIFFSTLWLAWGASHSVTGLLSRAPRRIPASTAPIRGRTAILVPVCNEDPVATFSRIAAMDMALADLGLTDLFDFAVLSDTRRDDVARAERLWFRRLVLERGAAGRFFYRRREVNTGRKAGNVEDFFRTSGAAYDYALILDADSLMEGATIAEMVRRMEAAPDLGLLQSLPRVIAARSRFGRAMQFSACFFSPVFARGLAAMQGRTGPFWGHNALVRVRAFAGSCGLPALAGKPPFGGDVMSHDYVEAALLARAGWRVRLDADLDGSFEEGPENIVDHAKRDRRWCQGNLQHSRLLLAPGLRPWSRFIFLQGIFAYLAPLLWGLFLVASIAAPFFAPELDYFPGQNTLFPVFPVNESSKAVELAIGVFGLLILPKLLIAIETFWTGRARGFGGAGRALVSTLAELLISSINAPIMLMFQTRSVVQVVMGLDGGWPPNQRGDGTLELGDAWQASRWITLTGLSGLLAASLFAPDLLWWLMPVSVPMILAPVIIAFSSRPGSLWLFQTPQEHAPSAVLRGQRAVFAAWTGAGEIPVDRGLTVPAHALA